MTGIRVREIRAGDLRAVATIEAMVFPDPWSEADFRELLQLDHIHGHVAEDASGGLVGYALCSAVIDEGELLNLAVAEPERGRGIGSALLDACLAGLSGRGAAKVFLEVRRSNAAAIAMYRQAGFATIAIRKGYYRTPTEDAVVMALAWAAGSARK